MRVLHLLNTIGPTTIPWELAAHQAARPGVEVDVLARGVGLSEAERADFSGRLTVTDKSGHLHRVQHLQRLVRQRQPQIVHTHNSGPPQTVLLARAVMPRLLRDASWVHTLHNVWSEYRGRRALVQRGALIKADMVVANSTATRDSVPAALRPADHRLTVLSNGIDIARIDRVAASVPDRSNRILFVGRLRDQKNPELFVRAASRVLRDHPEWQAVMCGDGPSRETVRALIAAEGMADRFTLTGKIGRDEVYAWMAGSAIYCLPSRYEGFGNSNLEAMAAGCAPVLGRISPVTELAGDAALYAGDDLDELSHQLRTLVENPVRRESLARAARERAQTFSLAASAQRYLEVYRQLRST